MNVLSKIEYFISNFIKYIRSGGVTYLSISYTNYGNVLANKTILITGGSSGIGSAIAKKFLSAGAKVIVCGRDSVKLNALSNELANENLFTEVWDLSDFTGLEEKYAQIVHKHSKIDILINNAGIAVNKSLSQINFDDWDSVMSTNLKSAYFLSKYFGEINTTKSDSTRKIVNISSLNSVVAYPGPYSISKSGLNILTSSLAKIYTEKNILVNGIAPGYTATGMTRQNTIYNAYRNDSLNKRIGLPEDVAELALFLASDASNHIIGQTIFIDGGQSVQ